MKHLRWRGMAAAVLVALLAPFAPQAIAQDNQISVLAQQIQRLRDDLSLLQRDYYQGRGGTPPAPAAAFGPQVGDNALQQAAQFEVRLSSLEEELRNLVGTLERVDRGVTETRSRLDRLVGDVDFRLSALEGQMRGQQTTLVPPPAPVPQTALPPQATAAPVAAAPGATAPGAAVAPGGARAAGTQLLGVLPADAQGQPQVAAAPPTANPPAGALPNGTPKVQYDFAYGLLQQFRIPEAERAFTEFLAKHPNDELSHNARYWLGETYYARGQYQQAAETFLDAYQKAPQGPKAADNMLKLGMSLGRLDRKQEACATLGGIVQLFPTATATLRDQATAERRRIACG